MISHQEAKFRSLKDLVDNQIADHFVIDSSALGTHFLTDHNGFKLVPHLAKYNNIYHSQVRDCLRSTSMFLEFIKEYGNIGATEAVLEELVVKSDLLNSVVNSYAGTRNRSRQRCQTTVTSALRKQKKALESILQTEREIYLTLKSRLELEDPDEDTLSIVEDLVINAQSNKIKRKNCFLCD